MLKIAFFEIEEWEIPIIKELLAGYSLKFFQEKLTQENVKEIADFDAVSVFIYSEIDENILKSKINIYLEFDKQRNLIKEQFKGWKNSRNLSSILLSNISEGVFFLNNDLEIKPRYLDSNLK